MAKWSGIIGYVKSEEVEKGVWVDGETIEHQHYGDTISSQNNAQQIPDSTNSNIMLVNTVSIVADVFATANFGDMRYIVVKGVKWKITKVQFQHPRIILTTGGVYNGK